MSKSSLRKLSPASFLALAITATIGFAVILAISSFSAAVMQADKLAYQKQRDTIVRAIRQVGSSAVRELRVQTVWTEGYTNVVAGNREWMDVYYGPYLNRLLNYHQVIVLSNTDEIAYSYASSPDTAKPAVSELFTAFGDLIKSVRGAHDHAGQVPVTEKVFSLGAGQEVVHRAASDLRLVGQQPMIVVVSTIVPDTVQPEPISGNAFLLVAMLPADASLLSRVGNESGFAELRWSVDLRPGTSRTEMAGLDGSILGTLEWKEERPAYELIWRMRFSIIAALVFVLAFGAFLSQQAKRQARSIDRNSHALERENETLERHAADRTSQLEATLNCMAQGLALLAEDGSLIIQNNQALELLGASDATQLREKLTELLIFPTPPHDEHRTRAYGAVRRDVQLANGVFAEIRSVDLPNGSRVVTISDISLPKQRQSELEQAIIQANAASDAKTRFLSTMSHEMRTPLNGVIGTLELLGGTALTQEQTDLLDVAIEASEALLVHINDVLDFSKMEAGKLELVPEPFDLIQMVQSVRDIVTTQAEAAGNQLVFTKIMPLPDWVIGDRIRLRQVLLNLVSNANKFTRLGRISIDVKTLGGTQDKPQLEISVRDTGIGIPEERIQDLFQEFSMLDSSFTRRSSGTGLGLAISKRLIEAMGGEIGVESIHGKGSRFWFKVELPVAKKGTPRAAALTETRQKAPRLNILLVDDNATNRLVGSKLLQASGHDVTNATNGKEAVQMVTEATSPFDLIFMDISMPELDGVQATQLIRQLPHPKCRTRIIALTANAIAGDRERFLASGLDGYLTKPLKKASITAVLDEHLGVAGTQFRSEERSEQPLLDREHLTTLSNETSHEVVFAVVESYLTEMAQRRHELDQAVIAGCVDSLKRCAHAIAGASASVGAVRIKKLASDIEFACIDKADAAFAISEAVGPIMDETLSELQQALTDIAA